MYKRQGVLFAWAVFALGPGPEALKACIFAAILVTLVASDIEERICLLYTSDAADERSSVDLGGRRIIKKKTSE